MKLVRRFACVPAAREMPISRILAIGGAFAAAAPLSGKVRLTVRNHPALLPSHGSNALQALYGYSLAMVESPAQICQGHLAMYLFQNTEDSLRGRIVHAYHA